MRIDAKQITTKKSEVLIENTIDAKYLKCPEIV